LTRQIGIYNLSWSSGKALGFLIGGAMVAQFGATRSIACAALAYAAAALAVPRLARDAPPVAEVRSRGESMPLSERRAFLRATWIANGIAFGLGAVLNHHLPRLFVQRGADADRFGLLLGAIFAAQTTSFLLLARWRAWHYRLRLLLLVQAALAVLAVLFARATQMTMLLPLAVALGLGLGFCYQSSLYYSLHAPSGRGRQAGIHEASLGIAAALLPLAGGFWVRASGDLERPFWLAAATLMTSAIGTGVFVLLSRRRR
jgi:predicted MFS family arabinose efflux permease